MTKCTSVAAVVLAVAVAGGALMGLYGNFVQTSFDDQAGGPHCKSVLRATKTKER